MADIEGALPLEDLLNAISAQLDRAQAALALKTQTTGLTFAVKDLALDLRAAVSFEEAAIMVRPAMPGERDVSTLRLSFTTVTRPMLEEHAVEMHAEEPAITESVEGLTDEEVRRLEWIGVRNLNDLNAAEARGGAANIRRLSRLPSQRLKQALDLAGRRAVSRVAPVPMDPDAVQTLDPATRFRLRVQGRNLLRGGERPKVSVAGEPAQVLEARPDSLIVAVPDEARLAGAMSLHWSDGQKLDHPIAETAP
jgi:hypothetical protein